MKKLLLSIALSCGLLPVASLKASADQDKDFFQSIEGTWSGPGEVVAGKYKGTKFTCNLSGISEQTAIGMTLDGTCRVGVFSQPMKATVIRKGSTFSGAFNDGAKGEGLDVTSGKVGSDHMVFALNRKQLNGALMARLSSKGEMNITVSVKLDEDLIPVVGMKLKRTGDVTRDLARK